MVLTPLARNRFRSPFCGPSSKPARNMRPACVPDPKSQSRRCSLKPPLRTKSVGTKVSEAEFAMLEERAQAAGLTLSEWVREVLLAAPMDGAGETGEVILAEVLALRTLFLNLQFRQGQGPMTEAEMRTLIERADAVKGERARERIEAARKAVSKADEKEAGEPQAEEG